MMNIHIEAEDGALGAALPYGDLVKLQAWFSPSFPVGAFSYSHGLEWVVEAEEIRDPGSLSRWIAGVLRYGSGRSDAILLSVVWRAVSRGDWPEVVDTSLLAAALQPTLERRLESLGQGEAFLSAVNAAWPHPVLQRLREACPSDVAYPVAVGTAAAAHGLPLGAVVAASLHAFAANLVSAGVRLVPLGQTDGLKIMAGLEPTVLDVAREACSARLESLGSASFLADVASMRHETQYTRLFRS